MLGLYLAGRRVFRIRVVAAAAAESVLFTAVSLPSTHDYSLRWVLINTHVVLYFSATANCQMLTVSSWSEYPTHSW